MNQTVLLNVSAKLARKCVFPSHPDLMCAFVCGDRMHEHKWGCVCGTVGLSLNTQRPWELPRAERTASVCVLVPSKQGNLENTKGAANKHNLIPPFSYTWLWISQCYSKDACLSVCDCVLVRVMQCQSLDDPSRRVACYVFLQVCLHMSMCLSVSYVRMSKCVACVCNHSSFNSERHASAAGKWQVYVPSHPGVFVCTAKAAPKCLPWIPGIEKALYCTQRCMNTGLAEAGFLSHGC